MTRIEPDADYVRTRVECFDFESLLAVVSGGRFEHFLIGPGEFTAELDAAHLPGLSLNRGAYSKDVSVFGTFDPSRVVIGQVLRQSRSTRINGCSCEINDLQLYCEGCELEFDSGPDVTWIACTIDRVELQSAAELLLGRLVDVPCGRMTNLRPEASRLRSLTREIKQFFWALSRSPRRSLSSIDPLRRRLVAAYVRALGATDMRLPSLSERHRIAGRGRDAILQSLDDPYCSQAICAAIGCNERSLEIAFRERFAVSPRRWHLIARLNLARRKLMECDATQTVTKVATALGFFEIGRFSVYYRDLFGESPSDTRAIRKQRGMTRPQ